MNLGHDNHPTRVIHTSMGIDVCAYCFNEYLTIDDDYDDDHNYCGTVYYCSCPQAIVEQNMLREIEGLKERESEIRSKYDTELSVNKDEIVKFTLQDGLLEVLREQAWKIEYDGQKTIRELFETALIRYVEEYETRQ